MHSYAKKTHLFQKRLSHVNKNTKTLDSSRDSLDLVFSIRRNATTLKDQGTDAAPKAEGGKFR